MENRKYAVLMIDSLKNKQKLLETLLNKTKDQEELIKGNDYDDVNWKQFDVIIEEKNNAINRIEALDDGFTQIFDKMKSEMDEHKAEYAKEIKEMQELIKEITELSVAIQTLEERNRKDIERIMFDSKREIKQTKKNLKVSGAYIASMYGGNIPPESSQIDDKK